MSRHLKAFVGPFVIFMVLLALPGIVKINNPALPWWRHTPELWVYPLQILFCGALLIHYRKNYDFGPCNPLLLAGSMVMGAVGIGLWILPSYAHNHWGWGVGDSPEFGIPVLHSEPMSLFKWLGFADRVDGFNPDFLRESPLLYGAAVGMRFLRMAVLVPLVEEIFWRGFLMRYFYNEERDFWKNPFGGHRWRSYWIVTILLTVAHMPEDWLASFIWGSLVYWLAVRTKSLGACVTMHATANLLLGLYVVNSEQWGFW